jgi:Stage II sporulation protein E (SpoIIE)
VAAWNKLRLDAEPEAGDGPLEGGGQEPIAAAGEHDRGDVGPGIEAAWVGEGVPDCAATRWRASAARLAERSWKKLFPEVSGHTVPNAGLRRGPSACAYVRGGGMDEAERDLEAMTGKIAAKLLERSHLVPPEGIAAVIVEAARPLGVDAARIYLADLQQRNLRAVLGNGDHPPEVVPIDSTPAGRAYRTTSIHHSPAGSSAGAWRVWIPLIDGTERLGVIELACADVSTAMLARYRMLASLAGLMVAGKTPYSDTLARGRRTDQMALQAEMVWAFLPPRTFATHRVLVAAMLEPAYEVGGDAFDYSLVGDRLHVSIFDAVGHDLAAGLIASVGMASCRSTRRAGGALADVAAHADEAIARHFGNTRFVTALLCELNVATGSFAWIPCGHPPPLLIRGSKVIRELARKPRLPLGLADLDSTRGGPDRRVPPRGTPGATYTERLKPGDRVLLYTDGITEGRAPDGTPFGVDRLSEFIIRHSAAGITAPETLRRLNHAIVDYQHGRLSDDATIVLLEWVPDRPQRMLASRTSVFP